MYGKWYKRERFLAIFKKWQKPNAITNGKLVLALCIKVDCTNTHTHTHTSQTHMAYA